MHTRIVLDANIFASALMNSASLPAQVLRNVLEKQQFELVLSPPILEELHRIFFYPKVRKRINKSDDDIVLFLHAISISSYQTPQSSHKYDVLVEEDPDDDIYLIAALDSHARYLVSGDQHLLKIGQLEEVKIVTAKEFLNLKILTH